MGNTGKKIWKCDYCGKESKWTDQWRSKIIFHKTPIPWDETLTVCSKECADKFDAPNDPHQFPVEPQNKGEN